MLVLCKLCWAICTPQDWDSNIRLITLPSPTQERKAFYETNDTKYTDLISTFCPKTVFQNSDEKQTKKNPITIRKINTLPVDRTCYTLSPPIESTKPKGETPPSDLPNLAENHVFVQKEATERRLGWEITALPGSIFRNPPKVRKI